MFQCSSASRKFLNLLGMSCTGTKLASFSALQRAENSSTRNRRGRSSGRCWFQCSSASRKFLNSSCARTIPKPTSLSFSALQRAENSSTGELGFYPNSIEFCFSALQRAENSSTIPAYKPRARRSFPCFSALQRAENSSTNSRRSSIFSPSRFSALQRAENSSTLDANKARETHQQVSVLFSEPKIPQHRPSHLRPSIFPTAMITLRHS